MRAHTARQPSLIAAVVIGIGFSFAARTPGFCQGAGCCDELVKSAAAVDPQAAYEVFAKAAECFFKDYKFNEACACFTKAQEPDKAAAVPAYFCALARYRQLKYLEEKQVWEEYFGRGNEYRDQITQNLDKAVRSADALEPVAVYAKLLLWRFHKDQEDSFTEEALGDLMSTVAAYGAQKAAPGPIKDAADTLAVYGERAKAKQVYALYMDSVLARSIELEELKAMGDKIYAERNLELSETVFDAYVQRLTQKAPKETVVAELSRLARAFSFKDDGLADAPYAEQLFQRLEAAGGKQAFTEELLFLRGYNLEKYKEFPAARDIYAYLLKNYPQAKNADRIALKIGLLSAYAAQDLNGAREYFTKLSDKEQASAESIASLYHLGLLSQWEDDLDKAAGYYTKLIAKAGSAFAQTVSLTQARLKEIEQKQLLDNRLRLFLDAALGQESAVFTMTKSELSASLYRPKKGQEIEISVAAYPPQSGCMHVALEYLWLGDLGKADPAVEDASFKTSFDEPGVKLIGVVITMPSGMLDRNIDFLDIE